VIRKVVVRRFKRFEELTLELEGPVVLAGLNNFGKTTVLQAIAAWALALRTWQENHRYGLHRGAFAWAPLSRPTFVAVPLRSFDQLWKDLLHKRPIEIELSSHDGWTVAMELAHDTSEQVLVRPKPGPSPALVRDLAMDVVYVPPMTGLALDEPVYQPAKIAQLLGSARPGEALRNLLVSAHQSAVWPALVQAVEEMFGVVLEPPIATGAHIQATYREGQRGPRLDLSGSGSGFQQMLMLLVFLYTRPGSLLLLDEPDAHLHVFLQDVAYDLLTRATAERRSQVVIATHSEVMVEAVPPTELRAVGPGGAQRLVGVGDRRTLAKSLGIVRHTDLLLADLAPGILYLEGHTDLSLLRAWAAVLGHPARATLTERLLWRPHDDAPRDGKSGTGYRDHFAALRLYRPGMRGLALHDGDAGRSGPHPTPMTGEGLQIARWTRYESESYLVHPTALQRYVGRTIGEGEPSEAARKAVLGWFADTLPAAAAADFVNGREFVEAYLQTRKARTEVLPKILGAAGLPAFPYTQYSDIAAVMLPDEIHPEVVEKLDAVQKAFGL
jgi:hypothetical protein